MGAEAFHLFWVYWLSGRVERAPRYRGALGVAVVLLGGLYLIGRLSVASAFLNATLWFRHHPPEADADRPPSGALADGR